MEAEREALALRNAQLQQQAELWRTMGRINTPGLGLSLNGNPFKTLNLSEDAPREVVDAAWKALSKKYHPDVGGNMEARTCNRTWRPGSHRSQSIGGKPWRTRGEGSITEVMEREL